jgi:hypothetical protein
MKIKVGMFTWVTIKCQLPAPHLLSCRSGTNQTRARLSLKQIELKRIPMANMKLNDGTLFMALESGASWPQYLRQLKKTASNVQAVVQMPGEPAEQFTKRVLDRWQSLLSTSAPPHRFALGTNVNWDVMSSDARQLLARGVLGEPSSAGANELIIWGGKSMSPEEQGRLLALAGALVEGHAASRRSVRVLFTDTEPVNGSARIPCSA